MHFVLLGYPQAIQLLFYDDQPRLGMIKLDRYGNKALSDYFKNAVLWLIILGVLILIFSNISDRNKPTAMKYSDFVAAVNAGQIKQVTIDGLNINGEKTNGSQFETVRPQVEDTELMPSLNKQNVVVEEQLLNVKAF